MYLILIPFGYLLNYPKIISEKWNLAVISTAKSKNNYPIITQGGS